MKYFLRIPQSIAFGVKLPFRAARLILNDKKLLVLAILPLVVTTILYYYGISSLQEWARDSIRNYITSLGWDPEGWAVWFANVFTQITLILVSAVTFTFTSSIVASPFNDFLAESAERHCHPSLSPVKSASWQNQIRLIFIDLGKATAATGAAIFALLLSWVPILNLIAFGVTFALVCFQFTSYPQTRRNQGLKDGVVFILRHFFACASFGGVISFLFAIPFVSSFALPVAVVGGTLLVGRAPGAPDPSQKLPRLS